MYKVLFVCLGNICRSPMAQFVFRQMVADKGLLDYFEIDSAATEKYNEICHEGIYYRTKELLAAKHIPFEEHYSRCIKLSDYAHFDYIIAMDNHNIEAIKSLLGKDSQHKIHKLLDFTDNPRNIKDPWYTGNFEECYQDITDGCTAFLKYLNL